MRILKVVTRMVRGGAQGTLLLVARELARRGHEVACLYGSPEGPEGSYEPELLRAGVEAKCLPALCRDPRPLSDLAAFRALLVEFERPVDVVHTYTSKAGFLGRLAASLARVPAVVHSAQGHLFADGAAIPGVSDHPLRLRLFRAMERAAAGWADRLVALSRREADEQCRLGVGRPERFAVIPNPVDDRFFEPPGEPSAPGPPGVFTCVSVGRLASEKGHRFLFDAFARVHGRLPSARLWVVGGGPERGTLERLANDLGIAPAVRFWGLLGDVRPILHQADVLVLSSAYEAQGIVLLEGMACGLPVVATRVGGVEEFVEEGKSGRLVSFGDAEGLAGVLVALAGDEPERRKLALGGRRFAERFRLSGVVDRLEALYREILAGKDLP